MIMVRVYVHREIAQIVEILELYDREFNSVPQLLDPLVRFARARPERASGAIGQFVFWPLPGRTGPCLAITLLYWPKIWPNWP